MQEQALNTWEEFTDKLEVLYQDHAKKRRVPNASISSLLFRGHGDSTWKLKTTLERARPAQLSLIEYAGIFYKIQPKLETLAGMKWETPTFEDYAAWAKTLKSVPPVDEWRAVPYLAYLRHHGFPSPLLDWTKSPYVAAFFAFRQLVEGATHASIWTYLESANSGKDATTGQPEIRGIGSRIAAHKRHFMQQSEYTVCTVNRDDDVFYAKHQDVFDRNNDEQDLLWKFNIPVSERAKVLTHLSRMNINAFSLFGSDDSLLEEMATTEFVLAQ